jgi:drug/metabolite transporter (DMT)-like permease
VSSRAWILFAAVSTLWGIPYLLIKVAVDDGVAPLDLAWVRVVLGAAVLLPLAWRAGILGTVRGRLRWLAVFAVVEIAIPFPLLAVAEQHVSSSVAAIVIAAAPLFVAVLALRFDASERVSRRQLVGLSIGLLGVIALVGVNFGGRSDELFGTAAVLCVAFCYAVGPMVLKRHLGDLDPRASIGVSLGLAVVLLTPFVAVDPPTNVPSGTAIAALLGLGLLCTAAALALYGALIAEVGAGRALVVTYVNPLVAVALGMAILGERPGLGAAAGLVLILGGSWFATGGRARVAAAANRSVPAGLPRRARRSS